MHRVIAFSFLAITTAKEHLASKARISSG